MKYLRVLEFSGTEASDLQVREKWLITRKATYQSESQKLAIQVIGGATLSAAVVVYTVITREPTLHPEREAFKSLDELAAHLPDALPHGLPLL